MGKSDYPINWLYFEFLVFHIWTVIFVDAATSNILGFKNHLAGNLLFANMLHLLFFLVILIFLIRLLRPFSKTDLLLLISFLSYFVISLSWKITYISGNYYLYTSGDDLTFLFSILIILSNFSYAIMVLMIEHWITREKQLSIFKTSGIIHIFSAITFVLLPITPIVDVFLFILGLVSDD